MRGRASAQAGAPAAPARAAPRATQQQQQGGGAAEARLGHVRPLGVAEGGVGVHDPGVAQILQRHQILVLPKAIQVPESAAEGGA